MVMSCCKNTYKKYIQIDGNMLRETFDKLFSKNIEVTINEDVEDFERQKYKFYDRYKGKEVSICTCICHVEGIQCRH